MEHLTEGAVVLCTVKKIEKTTIFLEIEGNGEGSLVLSEVAAGRIRNLREYVTPNKKIVCKILTINKENINLSLRRVTAKEREEVIEKYKKEKKLVNIIKTINNNQEEIIKNIKSEHDLVDFIEEAKKNPAILNKYFSKLEIEKLSKLIAEKINKEKIIKKTFKLFSYLPSGINDIKEILSVKAQGVEIHYLGSSNFSIALKAPNFKEANKKMTEILNKIEHNSKSKGAFFEIKSK